MANILDYLDWRGDVPLSAVPYNDADELVLCRVAYLPFEDVLPERFGVRGLPLTEAVRRLQRLCGETGEGRRLLQPEDTQLLEKLAFSRRFSAVRLTGYVSRLDAAQEKQFSALTALLPDRTVLAVYRGTDNTMVGWKEDFNMSFTEEIPAQRDAVAYLQAAAAKYRFAPLRVCGHSKGGNLAMYAAAFCGEKVQSRIRRVVNCDGPGFLNRVAQQPEHRRIMERTVTYLPQFSLFGLLLENTGSYAVVQSGGDLIAQHDLYSWQVTREGPVLLNALSDESLFLDAALKEWLAAMTPAQRAEVVDSIFGLLQDAGIERLEDFADGKKTLAILKTMLRRDEKTRKVIFGALRVLTESVKKTLPLMKAQGREKEKNGGKLPVHA